MSLEATFLAPMREFVKRELKEVRDLKDAVHKAHEDYLQQLGRYLLLKRGTDPAVVAARTQELVAVRRRFELGRYDLVGGPSSNEMRWGSVMFNGPCMG